MVSFLGGNTEGCWISGWFRAFLAFSCDRDVCVCFTADFKTKDGVPAVAMREISLLKGLTNKHVVKLLDVYSSPANLYLDPWLPHRANEACVYSVPRCSPFQEYFHLTLRCLSAWKWICGCIWSATERWKALCWGQLHGFLGIWCLVAHRTDMKDQVDSSSLVFICMLYAFQRVWRDIEIPLQISIQEKGSNKQMHCQPRQECSVAMCLWYWVLPLPARDSPWSQTTKCVLTEIWLERCPPITIKVTWHIEAWKGCQFGGAEVLLEFRSRMRLVLADFGLARLYNVPLKARVSHAGWGCDSSSRDA